MKYFILAASLMMSAGCELRVVEKRPTHSHQHHEYYGDYDTYDECYYESEPYPWSADVYYEYYDDYGYYEGVCGEWYVGNGWYEEWCQWGNDWCWEYNGEW